MAKFNNNSKKRPNYFSQSIQQDGVDFIYRKTSAMLKRDAIRVFKDIVYANIDFNAHSKYFQEPSFMQALITESWDNFIYHNASFLGLQRFLKEESDATTDQIYFAVMQSHCMSANTYFILHKHLVNILNEITYNQFENIESHLKLMVNEVRPYKNGINSFAVITL